MITIVVVTMPQEISRNENLIILNLVKNEEYNLDHSRILRDSQLKRRQSEGETAHSYGSLADMVN